MFGLVLLSTSVSAVDLVTQVPDKHPPLITSPHQPVLIPPPSKNHTLHYTQYTYMSVNRFIVLQI